MSDDYYKKLLNPQTFGDLVHSDKMLGRNISGLNPPPPSQSFDFSSSSSSKPSSSSGWSSTSSTSDSSSSSSSYSSFSMSDEEAEAIANMFKYSLAGMFIVATTTMWGGHLLIKSLLDKKNPEGKKTETELNNTQKAIVINTVIHLGALAAAVTGHTIHQNHLAEQQRLIKTYPAMAAASGLYTGIYVKLDESLAKGITDVRNSCNGRQGTNQCKTYSLALAGTPAVFKAVENNAIDYTFYPLLDKSGARNSTQISCSTPVISYDTSFRCDDVVYVSNNRSTLRKIVDEINQPHKFRGIGITLAEENGRIYVDQLVTNGPALKAGVMTQDVLVQIDGTPLEGLTSAQARELLVNPDDLTADLLIERGGQIYKTSIDKATYLPSDPNTTYTRNTNILTAGVELDPENPTLITGIRPGSPAELAGLVAGDVLTRVGMYRNQIGTISAARLLEELNAERSSNLDISYKPRGKGSIVQTTLKSVPAFSDVEFDRTPRPPVVSPPASIPATAPLPTVGTSTHAFIVSATSLNIRSGPSATSKVVGTLKQDSCVRSTPDAAIQNDFIRVTATYSNGGFATGYVHTDHLTEKADNQQACRAMKP